MWIRTLNKMVPGLLAAGLLWAQPTQAQTGASASADNYPSRPIRLIVPFTPGGGTDIAARIIGQRLGEALGQQIVVENRAGANGKIGSKFVAQAEKDGYTLLLGTISTHATDPELYGSKSPYNPVKDFEPVLLVSDIPMVVVTYGGAPAKSMTEFIKWTKDNPGKLNFASSGEGGIGHLTLELLKREAALDISHIPFRGAADAVTNLLAERVQLFDDVLPSSLPHIEAGKMRALAVTGERRAAQLPNVPTLVELGYRNAVASAWTAIFAPAGTPREIVNKLNTVGNRVLLQPETRKLLNARQMEPLGERPPEAIREFIEGETRKWSRLSGSLGLIK